jgi:hypothetical protein
MVSALAVRLKGLLYVALAHGGVHSREEFLNAVEHAGRIFWQ